MHFHCRFVKPDMRDFSAFFLFLLAFCSDGGNLSAMKKILLLLLWLLGAFRMSVWSGEVLILATSDMHGAMENMNRLRPVIERERQRAGGENHVLLVDAGDTLQGSYWAAYEAGALPMAMLRAMHYDFWVPGNHDFEQVPWRFHEFPGVVLGANWRSRDFQPVPWQMVTRDGVKIAVIGLAEGQLINRLLPDTLRWESPEAALQRVLPEVRAAGPDVVVLVQHDGEYFRGGNLYRRLRAFPEIDLVIGAHTHQKNAGVRVGESWFVQPGSHAEVVAAIRIDFDERERVVRRITSDLLRPTPGATEPAYPRDVAVGMRQLERLGDVPVGRAETALKEPEKRRMEGALAALIGRAMMRTGAADAAIYAYRSRRRTYPEMLTEKNLYRLFPFENNICTVALTPEELRTVLAEESRLLRRDRARTVLLAGIQADITTRGEMTLRQLPPPRRDGRIRLAVTDYYLAGSGGLTMALRHLIEQGASYETSGIPIREAVRKELLPPLKRSAAGQDAEKKRRL